MSEIKIAAEMRSEFGKGAARRIRREAKIPAVLYGHGEDPVHITLPGHDTMLALKNANALLSLDIDGRSQLALPKHVQRDPLRRTIEHVDLIMVRRGEKVTVDVPVVLVGDPAPGAMVQQEQTSISLEAEATHLPERVEVSVEGLTPGTQVHASDLVLPEGSVLQADPESLVVNITEPQSVEEVEAELEQAEAEAGIEKEAPSAAAEGESASAEAGSEES
ncbi:MAG TPA: 50S ribosomal protein L25/general stress protein Ctc [Jiangellales bacterium]|nr:50S ribosomal protein L25/general stress protein Ctc [Jiangellales bacterium]